MEIQIDIFKALTEVGQSECISLIQKLEPNQHEAFLVGNQLKIFLTCFNQDLKNEFMKYKHFVNEKAHKLSLVYELTETQYKNLAPEVSEITMDDILDHWDDYELKFLDADCEYFFELYKDTLNKERLLTNILNTETKQNNFIKFCMDLPSYIFLNIWGYSVSGLTREENVVNAKFLIKTSEISKKLESISSNYDYKTKEMLRKQNYLSVGALFIENINNRYSIRKGLENFQKNKQDYLVTIEQQLINANIYLFTKLNMTNFTLPFEIKFSDEQWKEIKYYKCCQLFDYHNKELKVNSEEELFKKCLEIRTFSPFGLYESWIEKGLIPKIETDLDSWM